MKTLWIRGSLSIVALLGILSLASCGSDSGGPVEPPDTGKPVPGHVYNWSGTGEAGYGNMGQTPAKTQLYWPQDVVFDANGTPYVLDWNNHRVIATNGNGRFKLVIGVAGGDFGDPCPGGGAPCVNVDATNAKLNHPTQVAFDPANGDLILAAWHNSMLFRLHMATGLMDRICGDGSRGYGGPDPQAASTAITDLPVGVVFDQNGQLVFADQANQCIRMIDGSGIVHVIAGTPPVFNGTTWVKQPGWAGDGAAATTAKFSFEVGQVADPSGKITYDKNWNLYVADTQNQVIRIIDTNGNINTFAGNHTLGAGYSGDNGLATAAQLNQPRDVAADANGNLFIADSGNHLIRMVSPAGIITTVVGTFRGSGPSILPIGGAEFQAENGVLAKDVQLTGPYGVAVDSKGRLWVCDTGNHGIRILYR